MPFDIRWEAPTVYWTFSGDASVEELFTAAAEVHDHPNYSSTRASILDFSAVEDTDANVLSTVKYAKNDSVLVETQDMRRVAVIATQAKILQLVKVYEWEMTALGWQVKIFDNPQAARNWVSAT